MSEIIVALIGLGNIGCPVTRIVSISGHISRVCKRISTNGAIVLVFTMSIYLTFGAMADQHYFSLKKIFPNGKCSPVIPNYELMIAGFTGGEITKFKIYDLQGNVVEVISIMVSKNRDQWAIVGSKTDKKVIFCLYSSGVGNDSVDRNSIK